MSRPAKTLRPALTLVMGRPIDILRRARSRGRVRFHGIASSGGPCRVEVLATGEGISAVLLAGGMEPRTLPLPLLREHYIGHPLGCVDKAWVERGRVLVRGTIDLDLCNEVGVPIRPDHTFGLSVGCNAYHLPVGGGPVALVRDWVLTEVSIVSHPGDPAAFGWLAGGRTPTRPGPIRPPRRRTR